MKGSLVGKAAGKNGSRLVRWSQGRPVDQKSAPGPLLSPQSTKMKETNIQKAPKAANDDLDAYVASVRAYLASPDSRPDEGGMSQSSTSKNSKPWQDASAAKDPRRLSATAKELSKKYFTKKRS